MAVRQQRRGRQGRPSIRQGVPKDRRSSICDPQMHHGRKTRSVRVDGCKPLEPATDRLSNAAARQQCLFRLGSRRELRRRRMIAWRRYRLLGGIVGGGLTQRG